MATRREVAFFNADGTAKADAVPAFALYKNKTTGVNGTPPASFQALGPGVWNYLSTDADEAAGMVAIITGGAGAFPARIAHAITTLAFPFGVCLLQDGAGALWVGTAPTIPAYNLVTGAAQTPPAVGTVTGLYTVTPTAGELAAGGVVYRLAAPAGAYPRHYTDSLIAFVAVTPPSAVAPVVNNFSPALPGPVSATGTLGFDVTIADGTPFAAIDVCVKFPALLLTESAYDGSFTSLYSASTIVAITNGFRFVLSRRGGWPDTKNDVRVRAVSSTGVLNP